MNELSKFDDKLCRHQHYGYVKLNTDLKRIGLIGGTGWPSTIEYYRLLNEYAQNHYGEGHSAKLLLWNIDFFEIRQHFPDGWKKINLILKCEIEEFAALRPSCIVICNNTLHEGVDSIKDDLITDIPIIHIVDITIQEIIKKQLSHVLLLGTKYTMECGYYGQKLINAGVQVTVPNHEERCLIGAMQKAIAKGEPANQFSDAFSKILSKYNNCDAVLTACTELPLVIKPEITELQIIDPMLIHCREAFEFSLAL